MNGKLNQLRNLFVAIYLAIDILYVRTSLPAYNRVVAKIQGSNIVMKPGSLVVAIATYALMGLGWWFLIAPVVERAIASKQGTRAYLPTAFLFALLIYGVFNGTNFVTFKGWDAAIALRDTAWGVGWITALTAGYGITLRFMSPLKA